MVLAKSKHAVGLGNSLMNDRFGKGKGSDRKKASASIQRTDQDGQSVRNTCYCVSAQARRLICNSILRTRRRKQDGSKCAALPSKPPWTSFSALLS